MPDGLKVDWDKMLVAMDNFGRLGAQPETRRFNG